MLDPLGNLKSDGWYDFSSVEIFSLFRKDVCVRVCVCVCAGR
jgi:hypothetical protein